MHEFDSHSNLVNHLFFKPQETTNAYNLLLLLSGFAVATYALVRFAESKNRLNFDNRFACIIAGFLKIMLHMLHTKNQVIDEFTKEESTLVAIGPHRTGWEAMIVASRFENAVPRFFATDFFNVIPGVSSFLKMFQVIPVEANATKKEPGRSANAKALETADTILRNNGCVVIFPQGNFSRLGQEPPRVYSGVARLAVRNNIAIHVVRLDGFWCLQNPLIPLFIRNSASYRAFLSAFHMNNVRTTLCCKIDFHLKAENQNHSDEEKIEEICAQLYAYYRETDELSEQEITSIGTQISDRTHLQIWKKKLEQDEALKNASAKLQEKENQQAKSTASLTK